MEENKGALQRFFLNQFGILIITLLVLILIGIVGKYLELKYEEQEKIRLEVLHAEQKKQAKIREKKELDNYINNLDLYTDNSLTKFVNNKVHYNDIGYIPKNLVSVGGKNVIDGKGGYIKVSKLLKENLDKMAEQFYLDTNNNIVVVSGYRSYKYQKGIKDRGCSDNLCAKAGYSEHQSGLAIDIYSASSKKNWTNDNTLRKYFQWFKENAYKYGFHNSYQNGLEVDGYEVEPWHWRYVGKKLATYLHNNNITFAEFYNQKNKYKIVQK